MTDLAVSGVSKRFDANVVLDAIDLTVEAGTISAILGPSGCGKTTLLRLIAGFDRPDAGSITLAGVPVAGAGSWVPAEARKIGYVAQEGALFPHLTVAGNITFGLARKDRRTNARVSELLSFVGMDDSYVDRYPHQLSGGQQQRIALARALAPDPKLVLLDEPFSSLDAALREETRVAVVDALAAAGATGLLVTHDQTEALSAASQVAVMRAGRFVQVGSPQDVYLRPTDLDVARFVGDAVELAGVARSGVVDTALGRIELANAVTDGPVQAMVRPEQVRLDPAATAGNGTVTATTYFGSYSSVTVELVGDEPPITAQVIGFSPVRPGDSVDLTVMGSALGFAPEPGSPAVSVPRPA